MAYGAVIVPVKGLVCCSWRFSPCMNKQLIWLKKTPGVGFRKRIFISGGYVSLFQTAKGATLLWTLLWARYMRGPGTQDRVPPEAEQSVAE